MDSRFPVFSHVFGCNTVPGLLLVILSVLTFPGTAGAQMTYPLPNNAWRQISLPCAPGDEATPQTLFGDDQLGRYGQDWVMYRFDPSIGDHGSYVDVGSNGTLSQASGYWILQRTGSAKSLTLPDSCGATPVSPDPACPSSAGCFSAPLAARPNTVAWNMMGFPFPVEASAGGLRVATQTGDCASGCNLDGAAAARIAHNILFSYSGSGYDQVDTRTTLGPWQGYWMATLDQAAGQAPLKLLTPQASTRSSPAKVYVGVNASEAERHAAEEFIHFAHEATGQPFTLTTDYDPDAGPYFIIGRENAFVAALGEPPSKDELGEDGYEFRPLGDDVLIAGATPRGTLYGVYGYLRDMLGWEWYSIDDPGTLVSHSDDVPLPESREVHVPRFRYREVFAPEGGDNPAPGDTAGADFAARNMLNGQLGHRNDENNDTGRMLRARQGWGVDIYSNYNIGGESALTDSARQQVVGNVNAVMHKDTLRPQSDLLTYGLVEHIDGGSRSNDPADLDFANAGDSPGAPLFELTRRAAADLQERYPNFILLGQAYLWSLRPPANVSLPDNAGVMFAPIEANWAEPLHQGSNTDLFLAERDHQSIIDYLDGWSQRSNHIWMWLYATNYAGYLQPLPTIFPMIDTIKRLDSIPQVEGVFIQDAYTTRGGSFAALHAWVYAKLMWDPDRDADELIQQFCDGYYGPQAGAYMYQYIHALHDAWRAHPSAIHTKTHVLQPYLSAEFLIRADQLLQQAAAAAEGNPRFARHVAIERMGVDWVMLLNGAQLKAQAAAGNLAWPDQTTEQRLARYDRLYDTAVNQVNMDALLEGMEHDEVPAALASARVERSLPGTPKPCTGVASQDCVDFQDLAFELSGATIVGDPQASDHSAARLPGDTDAWGIQLPLDQLLPEDGDWILYARFRVDPGVGASDEAVALNLGVYSEREQRNRVEKAIPFKAVADGRYHTVRIDGWPYQHEAGTAIWFAPPNDTVIDNLYVDRIIAVRANAAHGDSSAACGDNCRLLEDGAFEVYSGVQVGDNIEDQYPNPSGDGVLDGTSLGAWVADPLATDGSAAWAHRDNAHWAIQVPLSPWIPADGAWDLYASLRIVPRGNDGAVAFRTGTEGAGRNDQTAEPTNASLADDHYQQFKLPLTALRRSDLDPGAVVWFQTDQADLYVDRLIAVPTGMQP